ncbi:tetratricopeptide repeat protein [Bizionia argentinensis JUB59]|uniref:Tetratricopeptide repeat protein n=1 Tax=Bizionia argentinensis JUB59 TaxID=1046627 RepID=G2EHR1_9FLAO|nr:tetratricopeptide repeat protein [Bizionia argentinensis]EGV42038.1 tetratricopeptide repeat protein [Bizionia argentinensis JUB59]
MKKPILIALAILVGTISFAQKKELRTAEKAIKNKNYAEAKSALNQAEAMKSDMSDKQKSQYHILVAEALYAQGTANNTDLDKAIQNLMMVGSDYQSESEMLTTTIENELLTKANNLYKSNNFEEAGTKFEQLYNVVPSDTTYLYYAAVSAVSGQDYEEALKHYLALNDLGYTGVAKEYFATEKETGKEVITDKNNRDLFVKAGEYIKPGERLTESKANEITRNIAFIYVSLDKKDEALEAIKKARADNPTDVDIILTEANLQYQLGNLDEYRVLIEKAIELDPNNIDLFYNLGVLASEAKDNDKAKEYYQKVIDMDPTYINAQTNLAALILGEEASLIEEMNGLGTSSADNKRYDELKKERTNIYKTAIPYLEAVLEIDPNSIEVTTTLMNIYRAIPDDANYKRLKNKIEELQGE